MNKKSKVFNYTAHKKLWTWLLNHPRDDKLNWKEWSKYSGIFNHCFLCNYAINNTLPNEFFYCKHCPANVKYSHYECLNGLYSKYEASAIILSNHMYSSLKTWTKQYKRRRQAIKHILNIPIKSNISIK